MRWGLEPRGAPPKSRFLVRDDNPETDLDGRCLVPATALPLTDSRGAKWLVRVRQAQQIFCFAGIWKHATETWPDAYAVVTVSAYPALKFIKSRHIAILQQQFWADWLAHAPAHTILLPWPTGSLEIVRV